ncbi:MAG: nitroreductase family protein, partial [Arenicellales bacterium]|nr:nitroreductase family protein [Arenicellales bacterium]
MTIEENPTLASASSQAATLVDIMQRRRSVRQFQSGPPVSRETWRTIAQAARWAPTGANSQCWDLVIVDDPAVRKA